MPRHRFTSETAAIAGSKGKRGPNKIPPAFVTWMATEGAIKAQKILLELEGAEYLDYFAKLSPYVFPRMPIEIDADISGDISISTKEWIGPYEDQQEV